MMSLMMIIWRDIGCSCGWGGENRREEREGMWGKIGRESGKERKRAATAGEQQEKQQRILDPDSDPDHRSFRSSFLLCLNTEEIIVDDEDLNDSDEDDVGVDEKIISMIRCVERRKEQKSCLCRGSLRRRLQSMEDHYEDHLFLLFLILLVTFPLFFS